MDTTAHSQTAVEPIHRSLVPFNLVFRTQRHPTKVPYRTNKVHDTNHKSGFQSIDQTYGEQAGEKEVPPGRATYAT